jgi:hypothetical protein
MLILAKIAYYRGIFHILHTPVFKLSSDWIFTNLGLLDSPW